MTNEGKPANKERTCFIIMPITTPETHRTIYRDGDEHFKHVLDHLFIPAVEKAGFTPIPPTANGDEVIHAEIITHLETADLVLCDISTLNANVFFELGIRTSLDKPVCLVRDDQPMRVPFDINLVNHHCYSPTLNPWTLKVDIEGICDHLRKAGNKGDGRNSLWKVFGLTQRAAHAKPEQNEVLAQIQLLHLKFDALRRGSESESALSRVADWASTAITQISPEDCRFVIAKLKDAGVPISHVEYGGPFLIVLHVTKSLSGEQQALLDMLAKIVGLDILTEVGPAIRPKLNRRGDVETPSNPQK